MAVVVVLLAALGAVGYGAWNASRPDPGDGPGRGETASPGASSDSSTTRAPAPAATGPSLPAGVTADTMLRKQYAWTEEQSAEICAAKRVVPTAPAFDPTNGSLVVGSAWERLNGAWYGAGRDFAMLDAFGKAGRPANDAPVTAIMCFRPDRPLPAPVKCPYYQLNSYVGDIEWIGSIGWSSELRELRSGRVLASNHQQLTEPCPRQLSTGQFEDPEPKGPVPMAFAAEFETLRDRVPR